MPGTRSREDLQVKAKLFRGLADLSRLSILEALRGRRKNVSEVVAETGLSQPNTSMHLNCLWECGILDREVGRRFTHYWIKSRNVERMLETAGELLTDDVCERIGACTRYEDGRKLKRRSS